MFQRHGSIAFDMHFSKLCEYLRRDISLLLLLFFFVLGKTSNIPNKKLPLFIRENTHTLKPLLCFIGETITLLKLKWCWNLPYAGSMYAYWFLFKQILAMKWSETMLVSLCYSHTPLTAEGVWAFMNYLWNQSYLFDKH